MEIKCSFPLFKKLTHLIIKIISVTFFLITAAVEAYYDVWVIGDEFAREAETSIKATQKSIQLRKQDPMYMTNLFNIRCYQAKWSARGIVKFVNPLIDALNSCNRLLKYILMMADKDLLSCLKSRNACSSITIGSSIHYIIRQTDILLDRRHQDLSSKKPGAVISEDYPYVIWVRMLKRPKELSTDTSSAFFLRGKFNSILEERLLNDSKDERARIMSIDVRPDEFDRQGNLTSNGKCLFWKEVDSAMKKLDTGKITLKPRPMQPAPEKSKSPAKFVKRMLEEHKEQPTPKRFKLKTPPPKSKERNHKTSRMDSTSYDRHHRTPPRRSRSKSRSRSRSRKHTSYHNSYDYERHRGYDRDYDRHCSHKSSTRRHRTQDSSRRSR